jgi:hypothetical protein
MSCFSGQLRSVVAPPATCASNTSPRENRGADQRDHARRSGLHLRQWPLAVQLDAPSETGQSMGHEAIGVVEEIGAEVRRSSEATSS